MFQTIVMSEAVLYDVTVSIVSLWCCHGMIVDVASLTQTESTGQQMADSRNMTIFAAISHSTISHSTISQLYLA